MLAAPTDYYADLVEYS